MDALDSQLAGRELNSEKSAEVHFQLGAVYEQLAAEVEGKPQAAPEPKAELKKVEPKAAPAPVQKPVSVAEKPAEPKPAPKKPLPSKDDLLRREMNAMDDMEKEMREKVKKSPAQ